LHGADPGCDETQRPGPVGKPDPHEDVCGRSRSWIVERRHRASVGRGRVGRVLER
jgi:hypothetical protein